jgi:S1-C subfamily serine protease
MADLARIAITALLGSQVDWIMPCANRAQVARATIVDQTPKDNDLCGWIGVGVSPITAAFADSLGMVEPYGAIFNQPEPDSPAAKVTCLLRSTALP